MEKKKSKSKVPNLEVGDRVYGKYREKWYEAYIMRDNGNNSFVVGNGDRKWT